ncbi:MAG: EamA family transporter [Actinomycetota bacterium]
MGIKTTILALLSVVLATAGQLTLKTGMTRVGYIGSERLGKPLKLLLQVATTWQVLLGLTLFFVSAGFWILVLSRVPLSFAYPFAGLTYLLIALFGKFVLGEHVPGLRWFGIALIIAGILLVGSTAPPEPEDTAQEVATSTAVAPSGN